MIRTAKKLGIKTVAVYSDADAQSLHVLEADEAYCIGPAPSAESYVRCVGLWPWRRCGVDHDPFSCAWTRSSRCVTRAAHRLVLYVSRSRRRVDGSLFSTAGRPSWVRRRPARAGVCLTDRMCRYGFLSENAKFAERLAEEGIVFIGPPSSAIVSMGSKRSVHVLD